MVAELRKFVIPEIVYGVGAIGHLGQCARNYEARKVLLVTDPGVVAAGWLDVAAKSLEEHGIEFAVFSGVSSNPRAGEVAAGARTLISESCDVIVAIGGGSPMDCAKGIGIVSSNGGSVLDYEGVDKICVPSPPLICVPTTAGTSADVSQFAIVSDRDRKVKISIISKSVVPDVAIIDPAVTATMDSYLTACTGIDALVHAVEAYVSNAHSPLTDNHALEAIRIISSSLLPAIANPRDIELRSRMMLGSLEAGFAFSNASLGAVHAMAHSLGGLLDLPHGECNAMLLEHVVGYNFDAASDRYKAIAAAMGLDVSKMTPLETRKSVAGEIRRLRRGAGVLKTLGNYGVRSCDLPSLAANAMNDACMVTNPRRPIQRDIEVVYGEAI